MAGMHFCIRAASGIALAVVVVTGASDASARVEQQKLLGCWTQMSPYPRDQIPAGKSEWGQATWCFRAKGVLETWTTACGKGRDGKKGACDGWSVDYRYRWLSSKLEVEYFSHDGNEQKRIRHRCMPIFGKDRFSLTGCELTPEQFVRDNDPAKAE